MARVQPTHINAYLVELAEVEHELSQAQGRVDDLKKTINQRLEAEGKKPMFETEQPEEPEPETKNVEAKTKTKTSPKKSGSTK